jgi:acyl-coenzyme A synthetase/AMP-(fatty) acid ligase
MASFKTPKEITFVSELPKTGQGKIDKRALIAQNP